MYIKQTLLIDIFTKFTFTLKVWDMWISLKISDSKEQFKLVKKC